MKADAVIIDMDGTVVNYPNVPYHSSWQELERVFEGKDREFWSSFVPRYLGKPHLYQQWYEEQVRFLGDRGVTVEQAERVLFPVPYMPGFREFFQGTNGFKRGIVTSGFPLVAQRISTELHFPFISAPHVELRDGRFTGNGRSLWHLDKSRNLLEMMRMMGVDPKRVCYVGDTSGDISCFDCIGLPVAIEPKEYPGEHGKFFDYIKRREMPVIGDFRELNRVLECRNEPRV